MIAWPSRHTGHTTANCLCKATKSLDYCLQRASAEVKDAQMFHDKMTAVEKWMTQGHLPHELRIKIRRYYAQVPACSTAHIFTASTALASAKTALSCLAQIFAAQNYMLHICKKQDMFMLVVRDFIAGLPLSRPVLLLHHPALLLHSARCEQLQVWVHEAHVRSALEMFQDLPQELQGEVAWFRIQNLMKELHTFQASTASHPRCLLIPSLCAAIVFASITDRLFSSCCIMQGSQAVQWSDWTWAVPSVCLQPHENCMHEQTVIYYKRHTSCNLPCRIWIARCSV